MKCGLDVSLLCCNTFQKLSQEAWVDYLFNGLDFHKLLRHGVEELLLNHSKAFLVLRYLCFVTFLEAILLQKRFSVGTPQVFQELHPRARSVWMHCLGGVGNARHGCTEIGERSGFS